MEREDITCSHCEIDYTIDYESNDTPDFCPFCGEIAYELADGEEEDLWDDEDED